MKDLFYEYFQLEVEKKLARYKSILDLMSKFQMSCSDINRTITKSVTACGCIQIKGNRQCIPEDCDFEEFKKYMETHVEGELCKSCVEHIKKRIGEHIFFLTALASTLDIDIYDVLIEKRDELEKLGDFSLM